MSIKTTPNRLNDCGQWNAYCEATGTNVWAMSEGLIDGDEVLEFSLEEALAMGMTITSTLLYSDEPDTRTAI